MRFINETHLCNPLPLAWCYPGLTETYPPFSFATTIVGDLSLSTIENGVENTEKYKAHYITDKYDIYSIVVQLPTTIEIRDIASKCQHLKTQIQPFTA